MKSLNKLSLCLSDVSTCLINNIFQRLMTSRGTLNSGDSFMKRMKPLKKKLAQQVQPHVGLTEEVGFFSGLQENHSYTTVTSEYIWSITDT